MSQFISLIDELVPIVQSLENEEDKVTAFSMMPQCLQRLCVEIQNNVYDSPEAQFECERSYVIQLLRWFKDDFFRLSRPPNCFACCTRRVFMDKLIRNIGSRGRCIVEVYRCPSCEKTEEVIRYNTPADLLRTRQGKCSEWALTFALFCRLSKFMVRLVVDLTDHVWVEIFSIPQNRWIHVDPSEGVFDRPLMYENEWHKELSYILAVGIDDVQDVTNRYTTDSNIVMLRRDPQLEDVIVTALIDHRKILQKYLVPEQKQIVNERVVSELLSLMRMPVLLNDNSGLDMPVVNVQPAQLITRFSWTPNNEELKVKKMIINYSSYHDKYIRCICSHGVICYSGWKNHIMLQENMIYHKDEATGIAFLSKAERSERATVKWRFDCLHEGVTFKTVRIRTGSNSPEHCASDWEITNENRVIARVRNGSLLEANVSGSKTIVVSVMLFGTRGRSRPLIFREKADERRGFYGDKPMGFQLFLD